MAKMKTKPKRTEGHYKAPTKSESTTEKKPAQPVEENTFARSERGRQAEQDRHEAKQRHQAESAAAAMESDEESVIVRRPKPARQQTTELKRFLLLSGHFEDEKGLVYKFDRDRPTVIESPLDLDKMFMNKFRRLDGPTSPGNDFRDVFDRPALTDPPMAETHPFGIQSQFTKDTDKEARERMAKVHAAELGEETEEEEEDKEETTEEDDF